RAAILASGSVETIVDASGSYAAPGKAVSSANVDFNGDGLSDILWRNSSDNSYGIWEMNGAQVEVEPTVGGANSSSWQVAGIGDFFGNGLSDILWRNSADNSYGIWKMDGFQVEAGQMISGPTPNNWEVAGIGDFFANGISDILW